MLESLIDGIRQLVHVYDIHPILVNFTAALIPISLLSDALGKFFSKQSLTDTGWWTLAFAGAITPFTAFTGWLYWMPPDNGVTAMSIHKWLGTALVFILFGLLPWRYTFFKKKVVPTVVYLIVGLLVVGAVTFQGHLGGEQSLNPPSSDDASILLRRGVFASG